MAKISLRSMNLKKHLFLYSLAPNVDYATSRTVFGRLVATDVYDPGA